MAIKSIPSIRKSCRVYQVGFESSEFEKTQKDAERYHQILDYYLQNPERINGNMPSLIYLLDEIIKKAPQLINALSSEDKGLFRYVINVSAMRLNR